MRSIIYFSVLILVLISSFSAIPVLEVNSEDAMTNKISGLVYIDSFETNGRMNGSVEFSFILEENFTFFLFLPSAKGSPFFTNHSDVTSEVGFYTSEYSCENFTGRFTIGEAQRYPWDYYELLFLVGLDSSEFIGDKINFDAYFSDRIFYTFWDISYNAPSHEVEYTKFFDYLALSNPELNKTIKENNLTDFYEMKIKIARSTEEFTKSALLWIPPIPILLIIIFSTTFIITKKEDSREEENFKKDYGNLINLFSGLAFFMGTFLIALRNYVPPTLTFLEIFILLELYFSFSILCLTILKKKDFFKKSWSYFLIILFAPLFLYGIYVICAKYVNWIHLVAILPIILVSIMIFYFRIFKKRKQVEEIKN